MVDKKGKEQTNSTVSYFLIVLGVALLTTRFVGDITWTPVAIVKVLGSIACIVIGLWRVLEKK